MQFVFLQNYTISYSIFFKWAYVFHLEAKHRTNDLFEAYEASSWAMLGLRPMGPLGENTFLERSGLLDPVVYKYLLKGSKR